MKRCTLVLLALASLLPTPPASGTARDSLKVTGSAPVMTKTYPAFIGNPPNTGTGNMNWQTCARVHTYCDTIKLDIDPQEKVKFYSVVVTLSWPNPRTAQNTAGNDLNIAIWEPDPVVVYCCRNSRTTNPTKHPEVVQVGTDNPEPASFTLIVDNTAGTNQGYTLKAEMVELKVATPPTAAPFRPRPVTPRPPSNDDSKIAQQLRIPTPQPTPRKVLVPGPDGELTEVTLPILQSGNRRPAESGGINPIVPVALAIVLVGGGAAAFLVIRRRRAAPG